MHLRTLCATLFTLSTASAYSLGFNPSQLPCSCPPQNNVCGSDLRNYASECEMRCTANRENREIYPIYNGPCEDLYQNNYYSPYNPGYNPAYNPAYLPPYNPYMNARPPINGLISPRTDAEQ